MSKIQSSAVLKRWKRILERASNTHNKWKVVYMKKSLILSFVLLVSCLNISAGAVRQAANLLYIKAKNNPKITAGVVMGGVVGYTFTAKETGFLKTTRNVLIAGALGGVASYKSQSIKEQLKNIQALLEDTRVDVNLGRKEMEAGFKETNGNIADIRNKVAKMFQDLFGLTKKVEEHTAKNANQAAEHIIVLKDLQGAVNKVEGTVQGLGSKLERQQQKFLEDITQLLRGNDKFSSPK